MPREFSPGLRGGAVGMVYECQLGEGALAQSGSVSLRLNLVLGWRR